MQEIGSKKITLKVSETILWYGKTWVKSRELRVTCYELKASEQELKFKSASSNSWATS